MMSLCKKRFKLVVECIFLRHSVNKLLSCKLIPIGSNDRRSRIKLLQAMNALSKLFFGKSACMAENKTACVCYLIVEKFTEILLIHLALLCVNNSGEAVKNDIVSVDILNGTDNVAELSNAGRLDKNTVGSIIGKNLFKSLSEISDKAAADTAGIHFSYLNSGILKKSAVNADITEFVFDKHKLFALISLRNELFDKSSFSGAKKSGKNRDFCHTEYTSFFDFICNLLIAGDFFAYIYIIHF